MLALTRLSKATRLTCLVTSLLITSTVAVLFIMVDSFFLHLPSTTNMISPLQRHDQQNCAMSYAYPTFIEIDNKPDTVLALKYKLFLYREGHLDRPEQLYGVPALFIPGQAGSHKQIRSLASATTQLYHGGKSKQNIDYFTVDLNEELSALSGQTLLDQAEYMNHVIERILSLYEQHPTKPTSVIIIGHSMGGLVARTMFMLPSYTEGSINNIITLATPHMSAPLLLDPVIYKTYQQLTEFWKQSSFQDLTFISIAGGSLDNIVHSDGVNIESFIPVTHGFTTYTTSIPGVWTGADHMAILWCNQLVKLLASTLLEVIDVSSVQDRMSIYRRNLIEGQGAYMQVNKDARLPTEYRIVESGARVLMNKPFGPMTLFPSRADLQLLTNIDQQHDHCWSVLVCDTPESCRPTSANITILPSASAENLIDSIPYRLIEIDIKDHNFVGVAQHCPIALGETPFVQTHKANPIMHFDSMWDIITRGISLKVDAHHNLHKFPFIRNSLFALDVNVLSTSPVHGLYKPMMKQTINDFEVKFYRGLQSGVSDRITFHQEYNEDHKGLSLEFLIDNDDSIDVYIKFDWYGTLGRCVLRYGPILVNLLWVSTLVVLLAQLYSYVLSGRRTLVAYPEALVQCIKGPFLQLAMLLVVSVAALYYLPTELISTQALATKYMLLGSSDWLFGGLLLLALLLAVGLTAIFWLLASTLVWLLSLPLGAMGLNSNSPTSVSYFALHCSVAIGLLSILPPSAIFLLYFVMWLYLASSARVAARSDLPLFQNLYKYRQSWLIFLISYLPYYIPSFVVYIKNMLIGWPFKPSFSALVLLQDLPVLLALITLVTLGRNPDVLQLRYLRPVALFMNCIIVYQVLFGFLHPFLVTHYV